MQATVELPEAVLRELEALARSEGTTTGDLIQQIIEAHVASRQTNADHRFTVPLPLIPASETGPIQPVFGRNVDELLSRDHFSP
jgi:hypothetical protein